jgi:hypothetical protein
VTVRFELLFDSKSQFLFWLSVFNVGYLPDAYPDLGKNEPTVQKTTEFNRSHSGGCPEPVPTVQHKQTSIRRFVNQYTLCDGANNREIR